MCWLGAAGGTQIGGLPVFALCGLLAFGINALAFVPAYRNQTEHYYDLTGSMTYLVVVGTGFAFGAQDPRALLLASLVAFWALRLGTFLFARIRSTGKDGRFDDIKPSAPRFLLAWILQGLWVLLTLACALAAMTSIAPKPIGFFATVGTIVWLAGFSIEVVADWQKSRFRRDPENRNRFIQTGLWAWSRHPNYFGEIVLWCGIALIALPVLQGLQYATLISPVFVYLLLTRVSGIPLLDARAMERWKGDAAYLAYRECTPPLLPRPPRTR
jgi:steroid 5-alpha reductase family enzyme